MVQNNEQYDAILLSNLMCRLWLDFLCNRFTELIATESVRHSGHKLAEYLDGSVHRSGNFLDGADSAETLAALGESLRLWALHEEVALRSANPEKYEYIVAQVSVWRKLWHEPEESLRFAGWRRALRPHSGCCA